MSDAEIKTMLRRQILLEEQANFSRAMFLFCFVFSDLPSSTVFVTKKSTKRLYLLIWQPFEELSWTRFTYF